MPLGHRFLIVSALWVGLLAQAALAGPRRDASPKAAKQVDQAVQLYYEGQYKKAEQSLLRALESLDLDDSRKLSALQYLAFCQVALGDQEAARLTFESLLALRADFVMPAGTPPKITALFEQVKSTRAPPPAPPEVGHKPPRGGGEPRPLDLEAEINRLPQGGQLMVAYRFNSRSPFSRLRMVARADGSYAATLPAPASPGDRQVEYFLELLDGDGQRLAQSGEEGSPWQVAFASQPGAGDGRKPGQDPGQDPGKKDEDDEGVSIHWWLWPVVGAVLLGAGLAIGLTVGGDSEPTGSVLVTIIPEGP